MSQRIRQVHRALSLVFTAGVIASFVALGQGELPAWVGAFAAVPLALLWCTGMFLLVRPYVDRRTAGRSSES